MRVYLKGTVQRDFQPPVFFIICTGLGHWPMVYISFVFGLVFTEIFVLFRSSAQYDTAWSQVPRSMILHRVKFCTISYCAESCDFSVSFLKGCQTRFSTLFFDIIWDYLGHWVKGLNIFDYCKDFAELFEIDSTQYDTAWSQVPRSIILRRVKFRLVSYCAESCDFSVSFLKGCKTRFSTLSFT